MINLLGAEALILIDSIWEMAMMSSTVWVLMWVRVLMLLSLVIIYPATVSAQFERGVTCLLK